MTQNTSYDLSSCSILLENLEINLGKVFSLKVERLELPNNGIIGITGHNGSGKSTFLKALVGINSYVGDISIFGKPLSTSDGVISYMPQRFDVDWSFPIRVIDIVLMGMYKEIGIFGFIKAIHIDKAMSILSKVGMEKLYDRPIGELSGGQQQRVFFARALSQDALIYIMDEPYNNIDNETKRILIKLVEGLAKEGKVVICTYHGLTPEEVSRFNKTITASDGRLYDGDKVL